MVPINNMLNRSLAVQRIWITAFTLVLAMVVCALRSTIFAKDLLPVFDANCVKCHGKDGKVKGKVNLLKIRNHDELMANPDLISDLIDVLEAGEMPPESEPALDSEVRNQMVAELKNLLHSVVGLEKAFAHTPIRRMNRFQYNNAVQDLLDLNVDVFALPERMLREYGYFNPEKGKMPATIKVGSRPLGKSQLIGKRLAGVVPFPQDLRAEHGFDNRGNHLTLSPLLLESFFRLSQSILESHDFGPETCGIWNGFFAEPEEDVVTELTVRKRLRKFLARAFRRPVEDSLLNRYVRQVMNRIESGEKMTDAMKGAAAAAMCSPRFLYLFDGAGSGTGTELLTDIELASRLSFLLWGSGPDETLLEVANHGRLSEATVLEEQMDRMLRDKRLKRFCDSFAPQWLQLERIISSAPDRDRYPTFYFAKYRASMHMMLEPLLLFETILIENRSILELVDSNFSYRSELLEEWYANQGTANGKRPPTVIPFNRVPIADRRQGGVITTAAVMTMTSSPVRTQPITRGAWISTVIFNNPPKPPPADVPPLPDKDVEAESLTLRERFEAHRKRPDCAGCHAKIDPLGFALENYDPTGFWRDTYENGRTIDSSGVLFRRHKFTNITEFKDAILAEKNRFTRAFAAHLLAFALGREIGSADSPALDRIVNETAAAKYRLHTLIKQIVLSEPFLYKSNPKTETNRAN